MRGEFSEAIDLLEQATEICQRGNFVPCTDTRRRISPSPTSACGRVEEGLEMLRATERESTQSSICRSARSSSST